MTRIIGPTGSGRRRRTLFGVVVSIALLAVFAVPNALAVHNLAFELDGNTAVDATTPPPYDWESFFQGPADITEKPGPLPAGFSALGAKVDYALPDHSTYATGSKDTLSVSPGWQCKKSNNVGDKTDILNAYSAAYTNPDNGHLILYFGVELAAPNGDANVGMWFLQNEVDCDASGGGNVGFTGDHKDGDVFVVSSFTNGGSQANVTAYEWVGDDNTGGIGASTVGGALCGTPGDPDIVCAITNEAPVNTPWNSPDKDGGDLNPTEFFEGGIDLTAAFGTGSSTCFARFLGNTRSSQSLTATIFDFAGGELEVCRPSTVLTKTASASVTYTYRETNDGNTPLHDVVVTDDKCSSPTYQSGDANNNTILDPGETWVYTCTTTISGPTPSTGVTNTANGRGTDPANRVVRACDSGEVSGPTLICDQDERDSVTVTITEN
jgi:hypothetical protein